MASSKVSITATTRSAALHLFQSATKSRIGAPPFRQLVRFRLLVARPATFGIEEGRRFLHLMTEMPAGIIRLFGTNEIAGYGIGSRLA